jgi:hypothetical protein
MLKTLGWNVPGRLNGDFENKDFNDLVRQCVSVHGHRHGTLDVQKASSFLDKLRDQQPWVIKSTGLCGALQEWVEPAREHNPVAIWLTRDPQRVELSFKRRKRIGGMACTKAAIARWRALASNAFDDWPLRKIHVSYERIREACRLFDVDIV